MKRGPGVREDARNLTLIAVAAGVGLVATGAVLAVQAVNHFESEFDEFVFEVADVDPVIISIGEWTAAEVDAAPLLYGDVTTVDGEVMSGFLRWDTNEGGWADLLDAYKRFPDGSLAQAGIRFGHMDRIQVVGDDAAVVLLKNGDEVAFEAHGTDLGTDLRSLVVFSADGDRFELNWSALDQVDLREAPADALPPGGRLYGTLTTRSGDAFTGYVTWDIDEVYTTDILDGDIRGQDVEIPFGAIETIERFSSSAADVRLRNGEEFRLRDSNDVDDSNRGITVADPGLGQILVSWDELDRVDFHEAELSEAPVLFQGGEALRGEVETRDGQTFAGTIVWDADESSSWEMINGDARGVEFQIEFAQIASIRSLGDGAEVELRDGRVYQLQGSNDVNAANDGILIRRDDGSAHRVPWTQFRELRMGW